MAGKEQRDQSVNILEVRRFRAGKTNEHGEKPELDDVTQHGFEEGEDIVLFPDAKRPIKASLIRGNNRQVARLSTQEEKNGLPQAIFLKDGRMETRTVDLMVRESVVVQSFLAEFNPRPELPSVPVSEITHLRGTRSALGEVTTESPAEPEPQGSLPPTDAEYPES